MRIIFLPGLALLITLSGCTIYEGVHLDPFHPDVIVIDDAHRGPRHRPRPVHHRPAPGKYDYRKPVKYHTSRPNRPGHRPSVSRPSYSRGPSRPSSVSRPSTASRGTSVSRPSSSVSRPSTSGTGTSVSRPSSSVSRPSTSGTGTSASRPSASSGSGSSGGRVSTPAGKSQYMED